MVAFIPDGEAGNTVIIAPDGKAEIEIRTCGALFSLHVCSSFNLLSGTELVQTDTCQVLELGRGADAGGVVSVSAAVSITRVIDIPNEENTYRVQPTSAAALTTQLRMQGGVCFISFTVCACRVTARKEMTRMM